MYDTIIIGGGPAGLTAAIYASRRSLKTLVITQDIGGQAAKTFDVENYPGISYTTGAALTKTMQSQAETFGAEIKFEEAKSLEKNKEIFLVKTVLGKYEAKTIIIASGKKPKELGIPGENDFKGKGVTYCATCDAPFFRNKTVVVVGGNNSALSAAIHCSKIAEKVYIVHRSALSGERIMIDKAKSSKNIEIILPDEIESIGGDEVVKSIKLKSGKAIKTSGVIIEVGYTIDSSLFSNLVKTNDKNQIIIDIFQSTSVPGIFAAGDLTEAPYKQIVIAAGEGAKAALSSYDYIMKQENKKGIVGDWGNNK
jgi:thioredoxin-disulfide reductase